METVTEKKRVCKLCGKTIWYKIVEDDGRDWMGHQRGGAGKTYIVGNECNCGKEDFKKMCLNCISFKNNHCVNSEHIKSINSKLTTGLDWIDLPTIEKLKINDETKSCNFWVFNPTLAMDLFK